MCHAKSPYLGKFRLFFIMAAALCVVSSGVCDTNCEKTLRAITEGKEAWALVQGKKPGDSVSVEGVDGYIKGGHPKCSNGAEYVYGTVGENPSCTVHGHLPGSDAKDPRYGIFTSMNAYGQRSVAGTRIYYADGPDIFGFIRIVPGYPALPSSRIHTRLNRGTFDEEDERLRSFGLSNGVVFAAEDVSKHIHMKLERQEKGVWIDTGITPTFELARPDQFSDLLAKNWYMYTINVKQAKEGAYRAVVNVKMEPKAGGLNPFDIHFTLKKAKTADDREEVLIEEVIAAISVKRCSEADALARQFLSQNRVNCIRKMVLLNCLFDISLRSKQVEDSLVLLHVGQAYSNELCDRRLVDWLVKSYEKNKKFRDNEPLLKQKAAAFINTYLSDTNPVVRIEDVELMPAGTNRVAP